MRNGWVLTGLLAARLASASVLVENGKTLPLARDVDVVVIGGSVGAVAAACEAARAGAKVFVAAPRPYLGEDMAGKLRLHWDDGQDMPRELFRDLSGPRGTNAPGRATPLTVKRSLDTALLNAGIPFLTGTLASEPLTDAAGELAGVVIANRNGRQAIRARVVIDATERGLLARAAGAQATPFPPGNHIFRRMILAGAAPTRPEVRVRESPGRFDTRVTGIGLPPATPKKIAGRLFECEMELFMRDGTARSFSEAEQKARDLTFVPSQLEAADTLVFIPPDRIIGTKTLRTEWPGVDALDLGVFRPAGTGYLFVLGPMADIPREAVSRLMTPAQLAAAGRRVGREAARIAAGRPAVEAAHVAGGGAVSATPETSFGEHERGLPAYLSNTSGTVRAEARNLPVLAECDVVVAGAGTAGAPAGIAAARQGARTIVCDYLYQMGGVQTDGLIGYYHWGNRVGFTAEIDQGVIPVGAVQSQCKAEWYRVQNRKAGAEIWYGTMVCGAVVRRGALIGVTVLMPDGGRGVILCKAAIDATGNAELAAMAGEETEFISASELALQGAGMTPRNLGASYANTDIGFLDDTDAADLCFFALRARFSMKWTVWDQAQVFNSRERRRLVGAFRVSPLDVLNGRTYPDVVTQAFSNFDSHGFTVHEMFFIQDPGRRGLKANVPYRSLLPRRLDGLLVVGLGISAHRDALPVLRMQPDIQNQGYAAGTAAAMAVQAGVAVRDVDMRALQKKLIAKGILPEEVLTMRDSFPLPDDRIAAAARSVTNLYQGLEAVLADPARSLPLLKAAYRGAETRQARFVYAHVLAMMGQPDGTAELIERVGRIPWDKGWNYRGMGQFNRSVSWLDSYIIALGKARARHAVPALAAKARALRTTDAFSHFRAVALALEAIGDRSAASVLGELLALEGVGGHALAKGPGIPAIPDYAEKDNDPNGFLLGAGDRERSLCLRELAVARALYRLGDFEGRGEKTLRGYANDPRGAYARHAQLVLNGP